MSAPEARRRRVVLAGVGGDAHSVGLTVLRTGLRAVGYTVDYLGVQQELLDICARADAADAVLISNMDGHATYYLTDLRAAQHETGTLDRLWYLGGYPCLGDTPGDRDALLSLGFDRVFRGYVDLRTVRRILATDLARKPYRSHAAATRIASAPSLPTAAMTSATAAWSGPGPSRLSELNEHRDEVLASWWSGEAARDRVANAERMRRCAGLAERQQAAAASGDILIQPRTGVSDHRGQARLFRAMREVGADVLSFQIDSLTRNNRYADIEQILKGEPESDNLRSVLNGFPAVNVGQQVMAELADEFRTVPLQVRHSTRDPRLLAELTFGAGIRAYEGGAISYNLPYYRDFPISEALHHWRYVDSLAGGYYRDFGIVLDREFFGVLTACLVPPCLAVAVNVFEALLAAECGVKSVTVGYTEQGHRAQDRAAVRVAREITRERLAAAGHGDVLVHVVWHQFMGPFPASEEKARDLLVGSARSAVASGAVRLMLKTTAEARRIPSLSDNRDSLALVRAACEQAARTTEPEGPADEAEAALLRAEADAIVDTALDAAGHDPAHAVELAVRAGWLDIPFSPSSYNAGAVLPVRDCSGAVRLASTGNLPLPDEVRRFHRDALRRRTARDGPDLGVLIEQDMQVTAEGHFECWPLG